MKWFVYTQVLKEGEGREGMRREEKGAERKGEGEEERGEAKGRNEVAGRKEWKRNERE